MTTEKLWRVAVSAIYPNGHRAEYLYGGRHADEAAACDAALNKEAIDHGGSTIPTITKVEAIG